jgi:hypothetical protein
MDAAIGTVVWVVSGVTLAVVIGAVMAGVMMILPTRDMPTD